MLSDYTTEQLQAELNKRELERYRDDEILQELKRRDKERADCILKNDIELKDTCNKYNINIDDIK